MCTLSGQGEAVCEGALGRAEAVFNEQVMTLPSCLVMKDYILESIGLTRDIRPPTEPSYQRRPEAQSGYSNHDIEYSPLSPTLTDTPGASSSSLAETAPSPALSIGHSHRDRRLWKGVSIVDPNTKSVQFYGPSSSFAFMSRFSAFLASVFDDPIPATSMRPLPQTATYLPTGSGHVEHAIGLPRTQEECFLNLFFQTYHCLIPVVCEKDFRILYDSLWPDAHLPQNRRPCPLVDIVLSISIQYGRTFIPPSETQENSDKIDPTDAIFISIWYYRQCKAALHDQWEHPTSETVVSYILEIIYLQNLGFATMAYTTLGLAVHLAYSLGLHLDPLSSLSQPERERRRRVWWILCSCDTQMSIELGRPFAVHMSEVTCQHPSADIDLARHAGPNLSTHPEDVTWLSFTVEKIKLMRAMRTVHEAFYSQSNQIMLDSPSDDVYADPHALEASATLLKKCIKPLHVWLHDLPAGLKTLRRDSGIPLSTDRTLIDIDGSAPSWLQLQRISLELLYHSIQNILCRPFIYFTPNSGSTAPFADSLAIAALNHAIAITNINHSALIQSDVLNVWFDAYHIQWSASLTMIAFTFAYPVCTYTPSARKTLAMGIKLFDVFGFNCPTPLRTATLMRDLEEKAKKLMMKFRSTVRMDPPALMEDLEVAENQKLMEFWNGTNAVRDLPSDAFSSGDLTPMLQDEFFADTASINLWPDLYGCDRDMWASFLADLETEVP